MAQTQWATEEDLRRLRYPKTNPQSRRPETEVYCSTPGRCREPRARPRDYSRPRLQPDREEAQAWRASEAALVQWRELAEGPGRSGETPATRRNGEPERGDR